MRSVLFFVLITWSTEAQNGRVFQLPSYDNGHGWDIRLAVPGQPGNDYPTLSSIPRTRFSCAGKDPGYYADVDTNCQVFRVCTVGATYGFQSFLCPNGTLFNQAVFVCDWWMNVNCKKSEDFISNRNDKFENLKLGPQLMKDIKKMLTHPVRNPVNTNSMKSKLIVMQNYKPPSGQLFPNGALLAPPERPPSHVYFPTKAIQTALRESGNRITSLASSASTTNPQYFPPVFSTFRPTTTGNVEILQRQRLNNQNAQENYTLRPLTSQTETKILNGHAGQISPQSMYSSIRNNFRNDQASRQLQRYSNLGNKQNTQNSNHLTGINTEINQQKSQNLQYFRNLNERPFQNVNKGYTDKNNSIDMINQYKQQQAIFNSTKRPTVILNNFTTFEGVSNQVGSDIIPPTILTKTVAYSRLVQEPKQESPKSRITFKTWVIKPSRKAKLIAIPTPYSYNQPNNAQIEELELEAPYNYNKPLESVTAENDLQNELEGYNYPNPTPKSFESSNNQQISRYYLPPTTLRPSFNERLLTTTPQPLKTSRYYLAPVALKSSADQYLPPTEASSTVSNQYLLPNSALKKLSQLQNVKFIDNPIISTTDYTVSNNANDFYSSPLSTPLNVDDNNSKLSFSDILSKEKLDITINEIVNDTKKILQTASSGNFNQYIEDFQFKNSNKIHPENNSKKEELLEIPVDLAKPAKLIAIPSTELEPPIETFNNIQNVNKISNLPFLKETSLPTIERTVSIKITIPESIANYLFKTHSNSKLEILKTDSSNYLALKNTHDRNLDDQYIPIGKLRWDGNSNLSTSQDVIFSLVADSINAAKKYNNIIQENVISPTPTQPRQFQAVNSEQLGHISNTISKLTASQYTSKDVKTNNIDNKISQSSDEYKSNKYKDAEAYSNDSDKNYTYSEHIRQEPTQLVSHSAEDNLFSKQSQNPYINYNSIPQENNDKIYSGQYYKYPVPEVTRQIINSPNPANSNLILQSEFDKIKSQRITSPKNSLTNTRYSTVDEKSNVDIFNDQHFPSARLQIKSSTERPQLNTKDINVVANVKSGLTGQLQDKIVGTVVHPSDGNKFITYKKDQLYYLDPDLGNEGNVMSTKQNELKNKQEPQSNTYPDIITFHFIPSDTEKHLLKDELQRYQFSENNNLKENIRGTDIYNNNINDDTYPTEMPNNVSPQLLNQRKTVNTLYAGPSSYSAPQSSIGNLMLPQRTQDVNAKIEDLDENNTFNGYFKERPSRQFNF